MESGVGGFFRIMLLVLGLASPYPEVSLYGPSLYAQGGRLFLSVRASGVVGEEVLELLDAHVPVTVVARVKVWVEGDLIRYFAVSYDLERGAGGYLIDGEPVGFEELKDRCASFSFEVLPDLSPYRSKEVEVWCELSLYSTAFSAVSDLWRENPRVMIRTTIGGEDVDHRGP